MKIALLTIWHCGNYGAEFQTYATVKILNELGHEVDVIDFRLNEIKPKYSVKGRLFDFLHRCAPANRKFTKFWKRYIPATNHYITAEALSKRPPKADLYLVGSDQVWNPQITRSKAHAYFLDFAPQDMDMASYASSFGTDQWQGDEALTTIATRQLGKFKAISCREQQGCDILRNTFNVDAIHVLDPTLLHNAYPELTGNIKQKNTLAYYQLSENEPLRNYAKEKADQLGLQFVDVNHKLFLTSTFIWQRRSVQQWIKTIAESQFVITHSFHGLVLCLLYHRPFVVIYDRGNRSSRIINLLHKVGLENHLFTSISEAEKSDVWHAPINFQQVDKLLADEREKSISYLKRITNIEKDEHTISF